MKTFFITLLKVALVALVAVLLYHLFPVLALPLVVLGAAVLALGGVLSSGLLIVGVVGFFAFAVLLIGLVALAGFTSPLWVPVLALVGAIALVRAAVRKPA